LADHSSQGYKACKDDESESGFHISIILARFFGGV
jgi:hypothetical protein